MRVRLIGDNARYLARHWLECRLVDSSYDEEGVDSIPSQTLWERTHCTTPISCACKQKRSASAWD